MKDRLSLDAIYCPSDDIVARDIEGELIIVPLISGIGDADGELYTLNETGRAIWDQLDGNRSLQAVIQALTADYEAPPGSIEADVLGLVSELVKRRIIVAQPAE